MQTASAAMVCRMTHKPLAPPRPACGERSDSKRSAAERRNPGEGALPRVRACGQAPSPDLLRYANAPLASRPLPARGARWSKRRIGAKSTSPDGRNLYQLRNPLRRQGPRQILEAHGVLHGLVEAGHLFGLQAVLGDEVGERAPDLALGEA